SIVSEIYSFTSGTILSAATCSPSTPGTQPVSLNISLASFRRAISSLVITHDYLCGVGDCGSCDRNSRRFMSHLPTPCCAISIEIYHGSARELCLVPAKIERRCP